MAMMIDPKVVGYRIREIRKKLGLSMADFGAKIDDKSKSGTVSNWETGKNLPNNERLKRISELGGISVNELLYGSLENYFYQVVIDDIKNEGKLWRHFQERYSKYKNIPLDEITINTALEFINTIRNEFVQKAISLSKMAYTNSKLNSKDADPSSSYFDIYNSNEKIIGLAIATLNRFLKVETTFEEHYKKIVSSLATLPYSGTTYDLEELTKQYMNKGHNKEDALSMALDKFFISESSRKLSDFEDEMEKLHNDYLAMKK